MATIKFFIQSTNNPAGIYVRIREGRKIDAKAKTKFAVNPQDWSKKKGQLRNPKDEKFKWLKKELDELHSELLNYFNTSVSSEVLDSNWLKRYFNSSNDEEAIPSGLVEYYKYYEKCKMDEVSMSTLKKLVVNRRMLERFQEKSKKTFKIADANIDFVSQFNSYCINDGYSQNTISRAVKYIKTICYHAQSNGIETSIQLKSIKIKPESVEKIILSKYELRILADFKFESDYLDNARDWLLISCETAQRISDFMRFDKNMIMNLDGHKFVGFAQKKTTTQMIVPLNEIVIGILEKRKGDFPRKISHQKFNIYIKEICKMAGICQMTKGSKNDAITNRKVKGVFPKYELVSSHIGRRSFATNYYGIIPTSFLISATGHKSEREFLGYIGKAEGEIPKQLAQCFDNIEL
jgi:integrase